MKLPSLFTVCCFEVLVSMIGVWAQPRYRMMVDPPVQIVNPPPTAAFVNLCFREQGSVSTSPGYCPLGSGSYTPNGPDQPIEALAITPGTGIPPAYPTEEIGGNITILGVGLLVNFQDSGTNSLALHIFTQIGGEAPGTLFTIPSTQINGTDIAFTITIGATCLEEDTGVDCNSPPVSETTEITTATSTTQDLTPMTTEAPTIATPDTKASTTATPEFEPPVPATKTSTTTVHDTTTSVPYIRIYTTAAAAQCVVLIAAGIGWGVVSLLLNVVLTVVLVTVVLKRRNNKGYAAHQRTTTETTEEIDITRNPVYGIHNSKTNTGQDSQEYEEVLLH